MQVFWHKYFKYFREVILEVHKYQILKRIQYMGSIINSKNSFHLLEYKVNEFRTGSI